MRTHSYLTFPNIWKTAEGNAYPMVNGDSECSEKKGEAHQPILKETFGGVKSKQHRQKARRDHSSTSCRQRQRPIPGGRMKRSGPRKCALSHASELHNRVATLSQETEWAEATDDDFMRW